MKRVILFFLTSVFICLTVACYDDKGSYNYKDVNEIEVDSLGKSHSVIFKKDTLKITPLLKFTEDSLSLDRYVYEWLVVPSTEELTRKVIGTERDLNYFVELEPGAYTLYLKVRDKSTGLLWMNYTSLVVRTATSLGWLVIGEDVEGFVNLDMVAMAGDTMVLYNQLSNNGLPRLKDPKRVVYTGRVRMSSYAPHERLWIATGERSYHVNPSTFEGDLASTFEPLVYSYFELPQQFNPVYMITKAAGNGVMNSSRTVVCEEGHVFHLSSFLSSSEYADPINRTTDSPNVLFKAYPYIFASLGYAFGGILYNTDKNQFVRYTSYSTTCSSLSDKADDAFPWVQPEGRTLVYGENTMDTEGGGNGNSFALMKDAGTNGYYIYKFKASGQKVAGYEVNKSLATDIDKAELFAFASNRSILLYVVGKTLHAYDYKRDYEKKYSIEMEDEITMVKFDVFSGYGDYNDLYVATYNSIMGGTLQKYVLGTDQNTFELKPDEKCKWSGLVKVKDIDWKNGNQ